LKKVDPASWAEQAGWQVGDEIVELNGKSSQGMPVKEVVAHLHTRPLRLRMQAKPRAEGEEDSAPAFDSMRAMGTMANITGSVAPVVAHIAAPVSMVGGVCGIVGGVKQLIEGLSMPSGILDEHLVAKGSVTTGVGSTCAALAVGAAVIPLAAPPLILTALCVGVAGLGTATVLDASMDGLCPECRQAPAEAELEEAPQADEGTDIKRQSTASTVASDTDVVLAPQAEQSLLTKNQALEQEIRKSRTSWEVETTPPLRSKSATPSVTTASSVSLSSGESGSAVDSWSPMPPVPPYPRGEAAQPQPAHFLDNLEFL